MPDTLRYPSRSRPMDKLENQRRLKALLTIFGIPVQRVAEVAKVSRGYVSRIVNGDSTLGSPEFYAALERSLPKLIEQRAQAFFFVEPVPMAQVDAGMETLAKPAIKTADLKEAR